MAQILSSSAMSPHHCRPSNKISITFPLTAVDAVRSGIIVVTLSSAGECRRYAATLAEDPGRRGAKASSPDCGMAASRRLYPVPTADLSKKLGGRVGADHLALPAEEDLAGEARTG